MNTRMYGLKHAAQLVVSLIRWSCYYITEYQMMCTYAGFLKNIAKIDLSGLSGLEPDNHSCWDIAS